MLGHVNNWLQYKNKFYLSRNKQTGRMAEWLWRVTQALCFLFEEQVSRGETRGGSNPPPFNTFFFMIHSGLVLPSISPNKANFAFYLNTGAARLYTTLVTLSCS